MKTAWRWWLFGLIVILQWSLPAAMTLRAGQTLEQGTAYRLKTAPVDPADPFRGRYVVLDFDAARVAVPENWEHGAGDRLHAPIRVAADGYAVLEVPQAHPPSQGDWLDVSVQWRGDGHAQLRLPFDRYYLDEDLAPEAERLYRERNLVGTDGEDAARPAYAVVRVRGNQALIEELYIDDVPVRARVREALQQR